MNVFQKIGASVKRGAKNVAKATKTVVKKAGDVLQKAGENVKLAPLVPLIPVMKTMLKKKGIAAPSGLENLANTFYQVIILKKPDVKKFDLDPVTLGIIVSAIVKFVQSIIDKKKAGQKLTPEEEAAAAELTTTVNKLEEEDNNDLMRNVLIGAGVLVGLIVIGLLIKKLS